MSTSQRKLDQAYKRGVESTIESIRRQFDLYLGTSTIDSLVIGILKMIEGNSQRARLIGFSNAMSYFGIPTAVITLVNRADNIDAAMAIINGYNIGRSTAPTANTGDVSSEGEQAPVKPYIPTLPYGVIMTDEEKSMCTGERANKIEAIKSIRQRTNLPLKEAKAVVDTYTGYNHV